MIIIDACRADPFEDITYLKQFDDYTRKKSADNDITPWIIKNFYNRDLGDVVHVSGNPVTSKVAPDVFHALVETWTDRDAIDEDTLTVPPGPIIEDGYEAIKKYPNKRLIVHFDQPHYPFIPSSRAHFSNILGGCRTCWYRNRKNADGPNDVWGH
jgi:hypothetical protein